MTRSPTYVSIIAANALALFATQKAHAFSPSVSLLRGPAFTTAPLSFNHHRPLSSGSPSSRLFAVGGQTETQEKVETTTDHSNDDNQIQNMQDKGIQQLVESESLATLEDKDGSSTDVSDKANEKVWELVGLGTWITGLSSFLLVNNFVGPWPADVLEAVPVQYFGLTHALAGMLFGGGIILTTLIEWLATASKDASVLSFYFGKVPILDKCVVLPALTASIISGVGLTVDHYDTLGQAPAHVTGAISALLAFAVWWAATDLTTQSAAKEAVDEWVKDATQDTPKILELRKASNVVSCIFVAAIYAIMVLKPGFEG